MKKSAVVSAKYRDIPNEGCYSQKRILATAKINNKDFKRLRVSDKLVNQAEIAII